MPSNFFENFLKSIYGIEKYFPGNEVPEEKFQKNFSALKINL
jgi:hypothetical protein